MAIIAKEETRKNDFTQITEGVHVAKCVSIVDIGTQYSEKFDKKSRKIIIQWEIPDEKIEIEGEMVTRILSEDYNLSLHKKAKLRKHLEAWRGRSFTDEELQGFDMKNVLGKCCQIQIIHSKKGDNVYANIAAVMGIPKGMAVEQTNREFLYYDWDDGNRNMIFEKLPNWIKEKIMNSEEMKDNKNDDLPF